MYENEPYEGVPSGEKHDIKLREELGISPMPIVKVPWEKTKRETLNLPVATWDELEKVLGALQAAEDEEAKQQGRKANKWLKNVLVRQLLDYSLEQFWKARR